jgi:hypothetical protein
MPAHMNCPQYSSFYEWIMDLKIIFKDLNFIPMDFDTFLCSYLPSWQGESGVQSFDLDGVGSIPAIPQTQFNSPAPTIICQALNLFTARQSLPNT